MGALFTRVRDALSGTEERKVLLLGLDAAGKTTLLYSLRLGEVVTTVPTIGFNCERVAYRNIDFVAWDVGGQDKIRRLWHHYLEGGDALIFVVDSSDRERFPVAAEELARLRAVLPRVPVLVYANKQDVRGAASCAEVADALQLHALRVPYHVQAAVATRHQGCWEGLDWLATTLKRK